MNIIILVCLRILVKQHFFIKYVFLKSLPLQFRISRLMLKITTNQKFDVFIMSIIMLNMATMAMEHHDQSQQLTHFLGVVNNIFICIFSLECCMKLLALRIYYFRHPWDVFDFCVVVMSVLGAFFNVYLCIFVCSFLCVKSFGAFNEI